MHHHGYGILIMKTPGGYLTKSGVTNDISDDIIVLNLDSAGGYWAPLTEKVKKFLERSSAKNLDPNQCEILSYSCTDERRRSCDGCTKDSSCEFWSNRGKVKFSRFF